MAFTEMAEAVPWGTLPDSIVSHIALAVNGLDAIRWCAVNKEFHDLQPKLEVLVLGGYSYTGFLDRRVAVEDGGSGLTVRMPDGVRGLRIIEQIGARYGAELQRLYVALPGEAVRADPVDGPQLGSTLTDLKGLYWEHRQPVFHDDAEEDAWPETRTIPHPTRVDQGERAESVSQLITSVAKTLQVIDLRCCVYVTMAHWYSFVQLLPRSMRSVILDLTPFRSRHPSPRSPRLPPLASPRLPPLASPRLPPLASPRSPPLATPRAEHRARL
jgi:hypothetical protein